MKRLTFPCNFGGHKAPFHVYLGEPTTGLHPIKYQAAWLGELRGGTVPPEVMKSLEDLFRIAQENEISFEDLCVYALGLAAEEPG